MGVGFLVYMLAAAFGITALLFAVPLAYDGLRLVGAAYLLYLAWQALKPGGRSPSRCATSPWTATAGSWTIAQGWLMGTVLAGLGLRMALESRR